MITARVGDVIGLMHGALPTPDVGLGCHARHNHLYLIVTMSHDGHRVFVLSPERWCGWFSVLAIAFAKGGKP